MDSQGFVFLSVLQSFNRIKQLTHDIELLRFVCLNSPKIEFQTGIDGRDRVRPAGSWKQWVLAKEERDQSVQHDEPPQLQQAQYPMYAAPDPHSIMGQNPSFAPMNGYSSPPKTEPVTVNGHGPNGLPQMSDAHVTQTPLSATVPEFTPSNHSSFPYQAQGHAYLNENEYTDEQVDNLMIVLRKSADPAISKSAEKMPTKETIPNGLPGANGNPEELPEGGSQPTVNGDQKYDS